MNNRTSLTASHHDATVYEITNSKMMESPSRGNYIVGTLSQDGQEMTIHPSTSIVVKDEHAQQNYAYFGAHTNTRTDVQEGKIHMGQHRLIALGGIMNLVDEDGYSGIPLHIRNGKFPMSGKVTQPSGLSSGHPVKAVWLRINEEFGGAYVHHNTKTIEVLIIKPDAETLEAHPTLMAQIKHNKAACEKNIRREIAKLYPSTEKTRMGDNNKLEHVWKIKYTEVQPTPAVIPGISDTMRFGGLTVGQLNGIVYDEPARATTNVNLLLTVQLPGPLETLKFIDMEGYGRDTKLYAPHEIFELGDNATPALKNFGQRLNAAVTAAPAPLVVASAPSPAAK